MGALRLGIYVGIFLLLTDEILRKEHAPRGCHTYQATNHVLEI